MLHQPRFVVFADCDYPSPMARSPARTLVTLFALLLAACSSGDGDDGSEGGSSTPTSDTATTASRLAEPPPTTAWEAVLAGLTDEPSLQTAIDAFSVAFQPIAGATPTTLPAGYTGSGSGPLRWLLAHWDELDDAQRAEVESILAAWEDGAAGEARGLVRAPTADPPVSLVNDMVVNYETLLGRQLGAQIVVKAASTAAEAANALAVTLPRDANGGFSGPMATCTITFAPDGLTQTGHELVALAAHEVFHCFESAVGTIAQSSKRPPWIMEGLAEWAGETIAGGSQLSLDTWGTWLSNPWRMLFKRAYDAIGFYAHVDDNGVEMWDVVDAAIAASDSGSAAAYQTLVGGGAADLVESWAAGYFRDPTQAPQWDQTGPGITPAKGPVDKVPLNDLSTLTFDAPPYSAYVAEVDAAAEVITVESPGRGLAMLTDGTTSTLAALHGTVFCTKGECVCPDGSPLAGTQFVPLAPGPVRIAPTGDTSGSHVVLIGWTLDRFCQGQRCEAGTWTSSAWHVPRVITGGVGAKLVITAEGEGFIDWSAATDLYGVAVGGTSETGMELVAVKVDIEGASHFFLKNEGAGARVVSSAGSVSLTTYVDLGQGWMETGDSSVSGYSPFAKIGQDAKFRCGGNSLLLNNSIEFHRVSDEAEIPPEASQYTPTTAGGDGGTQGTVGQLPTLDPCALIPLAEVQKRFPGATAPTGPDPASASLVQCVYPGTMVVQVFPPMPEATFTGDAEALDLIVAPIPNVGDWAVAEVTKADPQFNLEMGVLLVAGGTSGATISIVPYVDVPPSGATYNALVELLAIAIAAS